MEVNFTNWDDFKSDMVARNSLLTLQYESLENGYNIFFMDGVYVSNIRLLKATPRKTNQQTEVDDFELNYKTNANKTIAHMSHTGVPTVSPTLGDSGGLFPKVKTYKFEVLPNTINIFDLVVNSEIRLLGGEYWVSNGDRDNVGADDFVEFSIVDKDDTLGLFAMYGMTVGTHIIELNKFVETDYIRKNSYDSNFHGEPAKYLVGANVLMPGLFRRVIVEHTGTVKYTIFVTLVHYEE